MKVNEGEGGKKRTTEGGDDLMAWHLHFLGATDETPVISAHLLSIRAESPLNHRQKQEKHNPQPTTTKINKTQNTMSAPAKPLYLGPSGAEEPQSLLSWVWSEQIANPAHREGNLS
jgi:hypothetical protein